MRIVQLKHLSILFDFRARNPQPGGFEFIQPDVQLPASIDWRKLGAVTKVKDQGNCGSCWAFSATGSLEGQQFLKTGKLVSLSEQNLVDCRFLSTFTKFRTQYNYQFYLLMNYSSPQGNLGCHGGLMLWAFNYIKENGGIDTEESYPYKGRKNRCKYDPKNSGSTCAGYVFIPRGNVKKLKAALATIGPVSIAIHVGDSFLSYSSGVYIEPNCSTHRLNHGVLAVGYETSKEGHEYLIVKNSWGKSWGEEGYIKMATKDNQCGIASASIYPLV